METSKIDPQQLDEKMVRIIETERPSNELASIVRSLDRINLRIDKLEAAYVTPRSEMSTPQSEHPSLDKFSIAEAIADQIFAGLNKEKACTFEPSKPCDHCSMCSSRGF